jgi:hypothetical protein
MSAHPSGPMWLAENSSRWYGLPHEHRNGSSGRRNERPDPPKWYRTFELPLLGSEPSGRARKKGPGISPRALPRLGSNQDSPDPESCRPGRFFRQPVGNRPLSEHRCPLPGRSLPAYARRNYGKTTAVLAWQVGWGVVRRTCPLGSGRLVAATGEDVRGSLRVGGFLQTL